ncbi:MAG: chorismate synthase [Erysipelotrichaceae bacterium]|nr:chorismate synthase [Erysipelotrichaceae bacterium]
MRNTLGNLITVTLFGESHGECVGAVIDGLPAGIKIDMDYISREMNKRRSVSAISTARSEEDIPHFVSGVKDGFTEGTPVTVLIENTDAKPADYERMKSIARPGHADYTAQVKYRGYQDASGGGHFSGRLTAPLVAVGSIVRKALEDKGILIGTHIDSLNGIEDYDFNWDDLENDLRTLNDRQFAVLNDEMAERMMERIKSAREDKDSVGGVLETVISGLPAGIGEPSFSSVESELASAMFSIGAVKGIQFGAGFRFAKMTGSEANDPFRVVDGKIVTLTNNNGGVNGGITNGMPVVFSTVIKPTPSIGKLQETVNFETMENVELEIKGRHDPAIVHRARAVVDALTALVIADLICIEKGTGWLA